MAKKELESLNEEIQVLESFDYSPLYSDKLPAVTYGYIYGFKTLADSLKKKAYIHFSAGVLAGIWIGIAYMACVVAAYSFKNPSLQKLLIGGIFPLVLCLIYFIGGSFLTAYMALGYPMMNGVARYRDFFKAMILVYLGNFVGTIVIVFLLQISNVFGNEEIATFIFDNLGLKKLYLVGDGIKDNWIKNQVWWKGISVGNYAKSIMWVFFSAIICNLLVSLSSQANKSTKGNLIGSIIMFWILIFMFAISGYQHCVANLFIGMAMFFIGIFREAITITASGLDSKLIFLKITPNVAIAGIFFLVNIIPAILGNYFGAVIMGFLLSIYNHAYSKLLFAEYKLKMLQNERQEFLKKMAPQKEWKNSI